MHSLNEFNDRRPAKVLKGGVERGNGEYLSWDNDSEAQKAFSAHGFNKGKAGDMAADIQSNVETSVARSKPKAKIARKKSKSNMEARSQ